MKTNLIAWSVISALLVTFLSAEAQQAKKVPLVGYLSASTHSTNALSFDSFRLGLRELGYNEGQNLTIEARWAE